MKKPAKSGLHSPAIKLMNTAEDLVVRNEEFPEGNGLSGGIHGSRSKNDEVRLSFLEGFSFAVEFLQ